MINENIKILKDIKVGSIVTMYMSPNPRRNETITCTVLGFERLATCTRNKTTPNRRENCVFCPGRLITDNDMYNGCHGYYGIGTTIVSVIDGGDFLKEEDFEI